MRRVLIESPFAAETPEGVEANRAYLLAAMRDSLLRGEAPFASHELYTRCLDDRVPVERARGIAAGLAWGICAEATVVYTDRGISSGMCHGIETARKLGRPVEYRSLGEAHRIEAIADGTFDPVPPPSMIQIRESERDEYLASTYDTTDEHKGIK